ncbi:MAG: pyridoxal phosphate-dependent aminotransferase [Candidatus Omnitrophica bacterium]|nr:pyridoxal phosphate-dependent aminotransferase [Candidatus Omnitrophota bacterium]
MKLADRIKEVKPSATLAVTAKAKQMKQEGVDVISFGAGEPDFDTPDYIKEAAKTAIDKGKTKYTQDIGTIELRKAICADIQKYNNVSYKPEEVIVSNGAKQSLYNIFQVLCQKGDEVIILSPFWVSYVEMVRMSEAKPVIVNLNEKDGFSLDIKALKKAVNKRTKAIIVNSPSNPTGRIFSSDELKQIAKISLKNNLIVISDEIYKRLIYGGKKHVSMASLGEDIKKQTIIVDGVSKTYSMTGWRIGYLASNNPDIVAAAKNMQSHATSNPCSISQEAAEKALSVEDKSFGIMAQEFEKRRDYMVSAINKIDSLHCVKPDGAFYVFCNISETGLDSLAFAKRLLEDERVAVIPGEAFGWKDYIRLSFATGMKDIEKGLDRMKNFVRFIRVESH